MTDPENPEKTTGGLVGRAVGKAKEIAGEVSGKDDLAREGRLQQGQGEAAEDAAEARKDAEQAEAEAALTDEKARVEEERRVLETERAEKRREAAIEDDYGIAPVPVQSGTPGTGAQVNSMVAGINLAVFKNTDNIDGT